MDLDCNHMTVMFTLCDLLSTTKKSSVIYSYQTHFHVEATEGLGMRLVNAELAG